MPLPERCLTNYPESANAGTAPAAALPQPPALSTEEFQRITKLAYAQSGIVFGPNKQQMVQSRLISRLRALGLSSFGHYLNLLERGDLSERQEFINALTTNLTYFFREPHHFPFLGKHLTEARFSHAHRVVWCAACSTGEEAYSIAIILVEQFNSFNPPVKVLATDIDTQVLKRAKEGVYPLSKLTEVSPQRLQRFFVVDKAAGTATVRPELRNMIVFRQVNLLDATWPVRPPLDAIFCRNVMIYFDRPTQEKLLRKFAVLMHPEGLFFAGHSENYTRCGDLVTLCGTTVYQLAGQGKALAQQAMSNWRPASSWSASLGATAADKSRNPGGR
jgi:chemotaxis protein methyltransferase CheR